MTYVNLTPHIINVVREDGTVFTIPTSGVEARVETKYKEFCIVDDNGGDSNNFILYHQQFGEVENLPHYILNNIYIVSALVRLALPLRLDVASPGELIRNSAGQPIGCRGLVVNPQLF